MEYEPMAVMKKASLLYTPLLFLYLLHAPSPANALEGELVINGFPVPKEWIAAYTDHAKAFPAKELCAKRVYYRFKKQNGWD